MKETRGNRLHITFLGKMNTGKSSIINNLFNREISIVSDFAGTTTDVNQKAMELLPLGSVSILDTAGIDDIGELGQKRVNKTLEALDRTDVAIIIFDNTGVKDCDIELFNNLKTKKIPIISIINKTDILLPSEDDIKIIENNSNHTIYASAKNDKDIASKIKLGLISVLDSEYIDTPTLLGNVIGKNDTIILVIPIDKEAPKGRIILPQVRTLRELLDNNCICIAVKESELKQALENLKTAPSLVITDSQAFKQVSQIVPQEIPLTSFSILFARLKGDLKVFLNGVKTIDNLKDGDKVLILESCTHHPIEDDIGRVKIPNLIKQKTGKNILFDNISGHDFPDISNYKLIIHCGACMTNRKEVLSRILIANNMNIPITNYGIVISYCLGILPRATEILTK